MQAVVEAVRAQVDSWEPASAAGAGRREQDDHFADRTVLDWHDDAARGPDAAAAPGGGAPDAGRPLMRIVRMLMADPLGEPPGGQGAAGGSAEQAPASPAGSNVSEIEVLEECSVPGAAAGRTVWPHGCADTAAVSPAGCEVSVVECHEEQNGDSQISTRSPGPWPRGRAGAPAASPARSEDSVVECPEAAIDAIDTLGVEVDEQGRPGATADGQNADLVPGAWMPVEAARDCEGEARLGAVDSPCAEVDEQVRAGVSVDGRNAELAPEAWRAAEAARGCQGDTTTNGCEGEGHGQNVELPSGAWKPVEAARACESEGASDGCADEGCAAAGVLALAARFGKTVQRRASAAPRTDRPGSQAAAADADPCPQPGVDGAMGSAQAPASAAAGAAEAGDGAPAESNHARHLGALALGTIDRALAGRISCTSSLQELASIPLPFAGRPLGPSPPHLGTWMVWMVHRLALDDPSLTELDFSTYAMPLPEDEPRIAPKLWVALARNTHLRRLLLEDTNLRSGGDGAARGPAAALASNRVLRVLNISSNFLGPRDLQAIFESLGQNAALEELRCNNQFCEPVDLAAYKALAEVMRQGCSLRKLGLELRDSHHRDQINRALVRNADVARKRLKHRRLGGG